MAADGFLCFLTNLCPKHPQVLKIWKNVEKKPFLNFNFRGSYLFEFSDWTLYFKHLTAILDFYERGIAYHVFLRFGPYLLNRTTYRPQTTTKIFRNACWRKVQMGETSWLQPFACEKDIYAFGDSTDVIYLTNFVLNHPLILERAENR